MNGDNRINNPIISNLTMSEEMKQNILDNCKEGKRTNDKLFRYSKLIVLFIAFSCVCLGGLGTHAAISAVQNRMENMSDEEKDAYLATIKGVTLGSDAFFPFSDNIDKAAKSGVSYVVEPGGSIRDDLVIEAADKHGMVMAFTGMRLFHH